MSYWGDRIQGAQDVLYNKSEATIRKHLRQQYLEIYKETKLEIEALLKDLDTPNDLYKLDRYYDIKNNLAKKLTQLGVKEKELFQGSFEKMYTQEQVLLDRLFEKNNLARKGSNILNTDLQMQQAVEGIWCADGKSWSTRIWTNTQDLQQRIEKGIENAILRGASKDEIVRELRQNFTVGFNQADRIARTELSHVQNAAAEDRYTDAGIDEVRVLASEDERTCDICSKYADKKYRIGDITVPFHPNCRCTIIPVLK